MIRLAKISDAEQIYNIEWAAIDCPWTKEQIETTIGNPAYLYLVEEGLFAVTAYASARIIDSEAEINNIAVVPHFRRRGIASGLLSALIDKAAERGVKRMFLEVNPANTAALLLYQKYGFVKISTRKDYYGAGKDAVVLKTELGG